MTVDSHIAIAIHGGAGTLLREKMNDSVESAYRQKLEESVLAGFAVLKDGSSSLDAVVASVAVMEDSELFNAGKGSVLNHESQIEMDASIMEGLGLEAGSVAGVKHIKNPIMLARQVLQQSGHVMLIGDGAEEFAAEQGFEHIDNSYFRIARREKQLLRVQSSSTTTALSEDGSSENSSDVFDDKKLGTVGAVAIDQRGNISAATSTGGMTNKRYGRVGDSPIIGAGTYADNRCGGVSATGHGEYFIRAVVAHDICARAMYKGISLQEAADEVVMEELVNMKGEGGVVAIDPQANVVFSFNSEGMYRAAVHKNGELEVEIFKT
ncbi:MAG: isoaspartyl peptidase/L-asparaginase [Pseudomonadales bacterium]|jgi:beta-aspartyl-peptidase (threonine type)